ncbi:MAG: glycosyltransferase family 4 protein [Planctomycetota bacterium]
MRTGPARILLVSATDEISGADESMFQLVRCIDPARFEAHVALPPGGPNAGRYAELGIPVHTVPIQKLKNTLNPAWHASWAARAPFRVTRMLELYEQLQPSIVHINSSIEVLGAFAARLHRSAPLVWHVREAELRPRLAQRAVFGAVSRWATAVIAISRAVGAPFAGHPQRIVIPNGVDLAALTPRAAPPSADAPTLGWLGRLAPGKGIENLITVFEEVWKRRPAARLNIVAAPVQGHRAFAKAIRQRVTLSVAARAIRWRDGTRDAARTLSAMDLLVHLPERTEGLGRTLIEAQAVGTPVLSWPRGGIGDAVVDGVGGTLVPVDDLNAAIAAAHRLLAGDQLERLSAHAQAFARERFAADAVARRIQAVYDRVLDR